MSARGPTQCYYSIKPDGIAGRIGHSTQHHFDAAPPGVLSLILSNLWQFIRDNWLSNRIFNSYDDILDHRCHAWNRLADQPCWGGRPPYGIRMCQSESLDLNRRRPPKEEIIRIGMDTSKHLFQLHGVNAAEQPILRKKLRRKEMIDFFQKLPSTVVAIEACGASHH